MAFLNALKKWINSRQGDQDQELEREREALRKAWNLDADDPVLATDSGHEETDPTGKLYDEQLWHHKLVKLCSEMSSGGRENLPDQIAELMGESVNLGITPEKIYQTAMEAFEVLVRHVVADRQITVAEHASLDAVRDHLRLPNEVAASILEKIVAEAEGVFQAKIERA